MTAEQVLEKYIAEHPEYWEFENELKVVASLKELCDNKSMTDGFSAKHYLTQFQNYG